MKFVYTEAALQELQSFQKRQQKLLESLIAERKFVFGDETVEVTASDIKEAAEFIRAYRPRMTKYSSVRVLSQLYVFLGGLITVGALLYPRIQVLLEENRVQAMAALVGITMMVVGVFAGYFYRLRARREEEIEKMHFLQRDQERT